MTPARRCYQGAQASPKGPFDVSTRLHPSRAPRCGSTHPHLIERRRRRGSAYPSSPNLSRLRLHCRCGGRDYLLRDGAKYFSPKLLVRGARPTLSLLAGPRAPFGHLFHYTGFDRYILGFNLRALCRPLPAVPRSAPWFAAFIFAALVGFGATTLWIPLLGFLGANATGTSDPVFGKDIPFICSSCPGTTPWSASSLPFSSSRLPFGP